MKILPLATLLMLPLNHLLWGGTSIQLGYIPIVNCAQIFVAQDRGLFHAHGLDVTLVKSVGGEHIMSALAAGELDFGFSNCASTIFAIDDGQALVSVVGGAQQDASCPVHGIFVRADSHIHTVPDLAGRSIAVNTARAIDAVKIPLLLEKHATDSRHLTFRPVPFAEMHMAVKSGSVDACVSIEPYVTIGRMDPGLRLISYPYIELQPITDISSLVTTQTFATQNPQAVIAFKAAIGEAARWCNANPQQARKVIARYVPLPEAVVEQMVLPRFMDDSLDHRRLDVLIQQMRSAGWIKNRFTARDIILATPQAH
ncbi:MAG: hypothetical protein EAZ42_11105 [Verrucomicrobia bacterium]|nr:MAG: hypothetical protein EAZ42_11105 [Verrucomicrobiota bacterium]